MKHPIQYHLILILIISLLFPAITWSHTPDFVALTKQLKPAVVNISRSTKAESSATDINQVKSSHRDFFEDFFKNFMPDREATPRKKRSLGSGFIISGDGYILTNDHVVDNADIITVQLAGGKTYSATIQGIDPKLDLALLKIDSDEKLPSVKLGNSDKLEIGEWVMAIGNPFGLEQTVTVGIVSAKGRVIGAGPYDNFIQTDASINPGNSGGPLFNTQGEVVGINTAIVAGGQGIGFAIPINTATTILPQLKETGHVTRGWLGITIQRVSDDLANSFGLDSTTGALISSITKDAPADRAGVKRGDIIIALNEQKIASINDLPRLVANIPVGSTTTITVFRNGKNIAIDVKIGNLGGEQNPPTTTHTGNPMGITTMNVTAELQRRLNLQAEHGVVITSIIPESAADHAKLLISDVIVEYNNQPIMCQRDFDNALTQNTGQNIQRLLIQRGEGLFFTAMKLSQE